LEGKIILYSRGSLSKVYAISRSTILQCFFVDWGLEQRRPKYQEATQPGKCTTQPVWGDRVLEGKEIDLVLFHLHLLGLWRLASSLLEHLERYLHSNFYILSMLFQICRSIVWRSSYYLNKGQI
jgi:hypothetical protein